MKKPKPLTCWRNLLDQRGKLTIASCDSGRAFADRIVDEINNIYESEFSPERRQLVKTEEIWFSNGEVKTVIKENIRGTDHYLVQCLYDPLSERSVNDNLIALTTHVDAARHSDADLITAVIPQFPYARQERRKGREGISAKIVASLIEYAGCNRIITLDIHSEAIGGFFNRSKLEDLHASTEIIRHLSQKFRFKNLVVAAPDTGSADKARFFSARLSARLALVDKLRDYSRTNTVDSMRLVGDVRDCDVFIGDDMIDTGGTIISALRMLKDNGANDIYLACSLPYFSGPAVERLDKAFEEGLFKVLIGTDAVFHGPKFLKEHPWYEEISVANLFAKVIFNINHKRSVSELMR